MGSMKLLQVLQGHVDRVWSVAWSPQGGMLASCSGDKTVRIWSKRPGTDMWICTAVLEDAHTRTVRSCCWSPSGSFLATASFDATTSIWEHQQGTWEQVATLEGHENEVKSVAWSPDGNLIATCGRDKSVWIWESLPGNEYECVDVKHGHSQDVKMVAWHPSGEILASASYDDTIKLWANDGDEWVCSQTLGGSGVGHSSSVWAIAFDPEGHQLASCSDDCTVRIWSRGTGAADSCTSPQPTSSSWRCTSTLSGYHQRAIYTLDWSKSGWIATGDGENCIKVFGTQPSTMDVDPGGRASWVLAATVAQAHDSDVNCVRWCPTDSSLLASCGDDGSIKLWQWQGAVA